MSFLEELRRRNVFRVGVAYVIVAWLLMQITDVVLPTFNSPEWVMQVFVFFLILGFPVAVLLAWAFELTPEGIKPTRQVPLGEGIAKAAGQRLNYVILGLLVFPVTFLIIDRYVLDATPELAHANQPALNAERPTLSPSRTQTATVKPAQVLIALPEDTHLPVDTEWPVLALSPDGSRLVFVAEASGIRRLYVRDLADAVARPIPGTEDAVGPFFSPDGNWIGFFAGSNIKKVASDGGVPVVMQSTTPKDVSRGATWAVGDTVIHAPSPNSGLQVFSVSVDDNSLTQDFTTDTEPYSWPDALPTGLSVLFTDNTAGRLDEAVVAMLSLETGDIKPLFAGGTSARYSSTGHILYARAGSLLAVPFDASAGELVGPEFLLIDGVLTGINGAAQFAVAGDGTLAYVAGNVSPSTHELVWVDREGGTETLLDVDRRFFHPRLSPNGTQLALTSPTGPNFDVWVLDLARGGLLTRWTTDPGEDFGPVWAPDGRLAFASEVGGDVEEGPGLALMAGPGQSPEPLLQTPGDGNWEMPNSWSLDGRWLLFSAIRGRTTHDLYRLNMETRQAEALLETPFFETAARLSPDGHWVAYVSDRSGRREIYVQPFPGPGDPIKISPNSGEEPVWARDGRELFYREGNKLMVVALGAGSTLDPSRPEPLFEGRFVKIEIGGGNANYDVSPDGRRFIMVRQKNPVTPTVIHVVFNWPEALRAPTR